MPDNDHLAQRRVCGIGIELMDLIDKRLSQTVCRVDGRISAVIDEPPDLKTVAHDWSRGQGVEHFRPPNRTAERAVDENNRNLAPLIRPSLIDTCGNAFNPRQELLLTEFPDRTLVEGVGEGRSGVNLQGRAF